MKLYRRDLSDYWRHKGFYAGGDPFVTDGKEFSNLRSSEPLLFDGPSSLLLDECLRRSRVIPVSDLTAEELLTAGPAFLELLRRVER